MRLNHVRILGWLVIAHGVSHAVLPLRGSLAPAIAIDDWTPALLYAFSMVGFVAAGLGLLGLRPFERAISPLLVPSSALSLVAIVRLGDPTLWVGGACDVALLLIGLWRAYGGWPAHPAHGRRWHVAALIVGFTFVSYVFVVAVSWPWHSAWGTTADERALSLPGDPPNRDLALEIQHAVTIDAPVDDVWPWLMQIGHDRAGFYSYDWLERAIGADIHNVEEIRAEWQERRVGDFVPATQRNYLGGLLGSDLGWTVTAVEPRRALVLKNWATFALLPTTDGRTRFIIRSTMSHRAIPVWASALNFMGFELPHFIMERRMMLTIKALAERHGGLQASTQTGR